MVRDLKINYYETRITVDGLSKLTEGKFSDSCVMELGQQIPLN